MTFEEMVERAEGMCEVSARELMLILSAAGVPELLKEIETWKELTYASGRQADSFKERAERAEARLVEAERLMREDRCPQCGLWHRDSPRVRAFLDREEADGE